MQRNLSPLGYMPIGDKLGRIFFFFVLTLCKEDSSVKHILMCLDRMVNL